MSDQQRVKMDEKNIYHGDFIINIPSEGSIISSSFSEEKWREEMDQMANASKLVLNSRARIFHVPQLVKLQKPEAYVPQNIAIGPYHQFDPKLYKMQKCKLRHARAILQQLDGQFKEVLNRIRKDMKDSCNSEFDLLSYHIRKSVQDFKDCYHDNLNISDDTLSRMMVYDGLFLLQLIYYDKAEEHVAFVDPKGRSVPIDSILKDAVMLENQIPLSVLIDMIYNVEKRLAESEFCRNLSPVMLKPKGNLAPFETPAHLLELIYYLVCFGGRDEVIPDSNGEQKQTGSTGSADQNRGPVDLTQIFNKLWNFIKNLNISPVLNILVKVIELVLGILEALGISISYTGEDDKPLVPTASQLASVNVKFCTTFDGVNVMFFKKEDVTLILPALNLKAKNLEVIIRNLIAFESLRGGSGIPKFANYIELMAAMIQTTEDVRVLQKNNVLVGDEDIDHRTIVKLFGGIKSCIKSGGNKEIDVCSKDINDYYESHWWTKVKNLHKKYLWCTQKTLAVVATIVILVLMTLQTVCSICDCHRAFGIRSTGLSLASS